MLRVPKNSLAFHLEEFLRSAYGDDTLDIKVPISLYLGGGLGSSAQVVQAIAQIALDRPTGITLRLPAEFSKLDITADRVSSTLHGMAALYFSETYLSGDQLVPRRTALQQLAQRVNAMDAQQFENTVRGVGISLCCFAGARREYLSPLYYGAERGTVRNSHDFRLILTRMVARLGSNATRSMSEGQYDHLATLLHELFDNADQHGSPTTPARPNINEMRGIDLRVTPLGNLEAIINEVGDDLALKTYLTRLLFLDKFESNSNPALLELTIFDTGPGMGLNWISKQKGAMSYTEFSVAEELDAVETCFKKHATTKSSHVRGQGLPIALRAMSRLGAFMTLRTGRVSLYQDFTDGESTEFAPKSRFKTDLATTCGTSFTILFRIR